MRALAHGLVLGLAIVAACAGGSMTSTATATDSSTATGSSTSTGATETDGMSSTGAASSTSTSAASTIDETDGATNPSTGTGDECLAPGSFDCDVWQQDCCAGEKCSAWAMERGGAWIYTRCVPVDPSPDAVGDPCTAVDGVDSCDKGAMCWGVLKDTNMGTCVAVCQGDEATCTTDPVSCCPDGTACHIYAAGTLILCEQSCHPLDQNCAGQNEVCYPVSSAFECAPDASGEMGVIGDPCEYINACDPGSFCGNPAAYPGCDPNAGGCCIPFCPLDMPECGPGTECLPWYDPMDVPPGYENLGACLIPP